MSVTNPAPRPNKIGWWYDCIKERWRWCFNDPGMGFCARENKSDAGHFWRVSNYNPHEGRWYGPVQMPNAELHRPGEAGSVARSGSPAQRESSPPQHEVPQSPAERGIDSTVPTEGGEEKS